MVKFGTLVLGWRQNYGRGRGRCSDFVKVFFSPWIFVENDLNMREPKSYTKAIFCLAAVRILMLRITARGFRFNNGKVKAKVLTLMGVICDQGIYGTGVLEASLRVAVACPYGSVNFTGESIFYVHSFQHSVVTLQILGMNVYLEDCEGSCPVQQGEHCTPSFLNHNMDRDSKTGRL